MLDSKLLQVSNIVANAVSKNMMKDMKGLFAQNTAGPLETVREKDNSIITQDSPIKHTTQKEIQGETTPTPTETGYGSSSTATMMEALTEIEKDHPLPPDSPHDNNHIESLRTVR